MKQLNEKQAVALYDSGEWKDWTLDEIAKFQLFQSKLCVPFDKFHEAIEHALGRPVWTHEFADQGRLQAEFIGENEAPTFEDIIAMIPADKLIFLHD